MCDKAGIYLWYNLKTGKSYIGQSSNLHIRKLQFLDRNLYSYAGSYINRARKKYNNSDWQYKVLKKCSLEELNHWEKYYIRVYRSNGCELYNLTDGGDSICGYKFSEESRRIMKESCRKASTKKLKVIQLSLNGNFIAKYCSARECEEVTGYKHTNIASACRGKYHKSGHKAYGYLWFYENKGNLDV